MLAGPASAEEDPIPAKYNMLVDKPDAYQANWWVLVFYLAFCFMLDLCVQLYFPAEKPKTYGLPL